MRTTKQHVNFRLDPDLLAAVRAMAERNHSPLVAEVEAALRAHIGFQGEVPLEERFRDLDRRLGAVEQLAGRHERIVQEEYR